MKKLASKSTPVRPLLALGVVALLLAPAWMQDSRAAGTETVASFPAPRAGQGAVIRVSKTDALINESVDVSWRGFRPSSSDQLQDGGDIFDGNTANPVRVYQCRGADENTPAGPKDCYGAPGFAGVPALDGRAEVPPNKGFTYNGQTDDNAHLPDGPGNWQDTVTHRDGSGNVTIQLLTTTEAPSLGCSETTRCSLVVVPNYGRDNGAGSTEDQQDAPWAWANRTVIPLSFATLDQSCPPEVPGVTVEGSPLSQRAMASWRVGACTKQKDPVSLNYTAVGEGQARTDVTGGAADVGLTVRPLGGEQSADVRYAPVSVSGIAVAFQIDDASGRQVRSLRLNPRLLAKIITASYRVADDPGVAENPKNLFNDPEFLALNPGVDWPAGSPGNHPLIVAELTDLTWVLTDWITRDKDARAFLDGTPDDYGMRVNAAYKGIKMPFESFPLLDKAQTNSFQPIQGLDHVSRQLSLAQFPGAVVSVDNGVTVVQKPPRQNPGRREVIGIIDAASAQAFRLPTAQLLNPAGKYVPMTEASMRQAIAATKPNADHVTRGWRLPERAGGAYPLTVLTSAVVKSGLDKQQATPIAKFLRHAATDGQVRGDSAGQLPAGYLALPEELRKITTKVAAQLESGVTASSEDGTGTGGGGTAAAATGSADGGSASGSGSGSASEPTTTSHSTTAADAKDARTSPAAVEYAAQTAMLLPPLPVDVPGLSGLVPRVIALGVLLGLAGLAAYGALVYRDRRVAVAPVEPADGQNGDDR
jgi:ABC-type phosphate transport system substrate-binding protein